MKNYIFVFGLFLGLQSKAQLPVDVSAYNNKAGTILAVKGNSLNIKWPSGNNHFGELLLDLEEGKPLFKSIRINTNTFSKEIANDLDPVFLLNIGKRTLNPKSAGWDVFFDNVPHRPYKSYNVDFNKRSASVSSSGIQTIIRIAELHAATFKGAVEITLYNGSPLFNVAAVMATDIDSTAILYDAGLVSKKNIWNKIGWSNTDAILQTAVANANDTSRNLKVKYRTIIGESEGGSLAVFPAPHQYFYPLDEAFNLNFTWYGNNYRKMVPGFAMGIRQDPLGDRRYVPWFNAPPKTQQRMNFFCLISDEKAGVVLEEVKKFTNGDSFKPLPGYKTMASHFHNEFISNVVMRGKPIPKEPNFVKVFKALGVDIVNLAEFHGTGHPKGPDSIRLVELKALFEQCARLSDKKFLLLPGEEANNFYGGHWLAFFPKPVYWVMSRKPEMPFVTNDSQYGKVYRVADKNEMLKLLEIEKGLAWTAHARTKSSTEFPDAYKEEAFFKSDTYMGAAWKAIPADLSLPTLSKRVLNLMDDMNNWGLKKHVIGEVDIFTIEPENEMYAHFNINYLQMNKLPDFKEGWQPVLNTMEKGKFFTTTGEVLLPSFDVNGKGAGETVLIGKEGKATINLKINWTFPLNFAEIVSGDGNQVYRQRINLNNHKAFGNKQFNLPCNLANRKWVRVEVWDIAANGAFTQTVWLNN